MISEKVNRGFFCQNPTTAEENNTEDCLLSSVINAALFRRLSEESQCMKTRDFKRAPSWGSLHGRSHGTGWGWGRSYTHGLSHFSYAIATPWCTVHWCRACTSRLGGWLPPCSAVSLHHSCFTEQSFPTPRNSSLFLLAHSVAKRVYTCDWILYRFRLPSPSLIRFLSKQVNFRWRQRETKNQAGTELSTLENILDILKCLLSKDKLYRRQ